jgi:CheY-like chemotaxis protein
MIIKTLLYCSLLLVLILADVQTQDVRMKLSTDLSRTDEFCVHGTIDNDTPAPKSGNIEIRDYSGFFRNQRVYVPTIPAGGSQDIHVCLKFPVNPKLEDIPEKIFFTFASENKLVASVVPNSKQFTKLLHTMPVIHGELLLQRVRVLYVGYAGSGKTTLVRAMVTTHRDNVYQGATGRNSVGRDTTELTNHTLSDTIPMDHIDSVGQEAGTLQKISIMLNGGYVIGENMVKNTQEELYAMWNRWEGLTANKSKLQLLQEQEIHVVVFVVHIDAYDNELESAVIKETYKTIKASGSVPLVMISHHERITDEKEKRNKIDTLTTELFGNEKNVVFLTNVYVDEHEKANLKDIKNLKILNRILEHARDFVKMRWDNDKELRKEVFEQLGKGNGVYIGAFVAIAAILVIGIVAKMTFLPSSQNDHAKLYESSSSSRSNLLVLVVEDNKINQKVLVRMLEKAKCKCQVANDGVEGLDIFLANSFDLVFMDVAMPRMDGYECTKKIREWEKEHGKNAVPIVGLSGNVRAEHHDMGFQAGMTKYMNKPIQVDEIMSIIYEYSFKLKQPVASSTAEGELPISLDQKKGYVDIVSKLVSEMDLPRKVVEHILNVKKGDVEQTKGTLLSLKQTTHAQ